MDLSSTEENYLKAIYKIVERSGNAASTNGIAHELQTSAASVSDMLRRLSEKGLLNYQKYKGSELTEEGVQVATKLIRNHRLWEVFLVDKLNFTWDEIHEIAEELEHIHNPKLIQRLESFLGYPKFDPHGDPIPNQAGDFQVRKQEQLHKLTKGEKAVIVGVREHATSFLKFLEQQGLVLGTEIKLKETYAFDESVMIEVDGKDKIVSQKVAQNIYVQQSK